MACQVDAKILGIHYSCGFLNPIFLAFCTFKLFYIANKQKTDNCCKLPYSIYIAIYND